MNILLILWFTDSGGYDIFSESVCHITLCQYVQTYDKYQASAVTQSCDMSEAWVISILPLILCHVMWGMRTQFEHFLSSSVMWHEGCAHNLNISSHPTSCDMRDAHTISAIPVSLSFSSITFLYHVFFTSYPPWDPYSAYPCLDCCTPCIISHTGLHDIAQPPRPPPSMYMLGPYCKGHHQTSGLEILYDLGLLSVA